MTLYDRFLEDYTQLGVRGFSTQCLCWKYQTITRKAANNWRGYGILKINNRRAYVHRLAYHYLVDQSFPIWEDGNDLWIDHKCRTTDCFDPTHLVLETNRMNTVKGLVSKLNKEKSSRFTGVTWNKNMNKWRACIFIEGKKLHLGYFYIEEDAANAYQKALSKL